MAVRTKRKIVKTVRTIRRTAEAMRDNIDQVIMILIMVFGAALFSIIAGVALEMVGSGILAAIVFIIVGIVLSIKSSVN